MLTISRPDVERDAIVDFPADKRFRLVSLHYQPDVAADSFQQAFPHLHRQFIVENMPNCCHEIRAVLEVQSR